jgi:small subunit ribosomal protein S14
MAKKSKINRNQQKLKYEIRHRNRCAICGRPRGYYRFFNICRVCFRTFALKGYLPGVTKSSW